MVIESSALEEALKEANQEDFLKLCRRCQAVICCRVSPMQKAQVRGIGSAVWEG
jgi:phospholipid-translocating ATPase